LDLVEESFLAYFGVWILHIQWVRWSGIISYNQLPNPFCLQVKLNVLTPNMVAPFGPL
jgi:hypothetical protein